MGINTVIDIGGGQYGFLVSLASDLSRDHNVTITSSPGMKSAIEGLAPDIGTRVEGRAKLTSDFPAEQIIDECLKREVKYGECFSMVSSHERGLGKGYLLNADRHPDMVRSWWPHPRKLGRMLEDFLYYEHIIDKYSPDVLIQSANSKIPCLVARHRHIPTFAIAPARLGGRYMWVEDEYLHNHWLAEAIDRNLAATGAPVQETPIDYQQVAASRARHRSIDYSWGYAIEASARRVVRESSQRARARVVNALLRKPLPSNVDGYRYLSWVGPILRRPWSYRYFLKHGVSPQELKDYKLVYFPLHLEPEIALLAVSPEFNNSIEAISWISKSLPADTILVVKEQPISFGIRSKHYYDNLRRIGNVALAHPSAHPWDWIKASRITATITGTAGTEAVYFHRPVLSFGKHQVINRLPTVRYVFNYDSTRRAVAELLAMDPAHQVFLKSKHALYDAQMKTSFELPDFENPERVSRLAPDLARIAIEKLSQQYGAVFLKQ